MLRIYSLRPRRSLSGGPGHDWCCMGPITGVHHDRFPWRDLDERLGSTRRAKSSAVTRTPAGGRTASC